MTGPTTFGGAFVTSLPSSCGSTADLLTTITLVMARSEREGNLSIGAGFLFC